MYVPAFLPPPYPPYLYLPNTNAFSVLRPEHLISSPLTSFPTYAVTHDAPMSSNTSDEMSYMDYENWTMEDGGYMMDIREVHD
jgi:hypothetical protein